MTTIINSETIREKFSVARGLGKRAKDAAHSIGISEGEAVAAHCGIHDYAPKAKALKSNWIALLQALETCGPLMALTRNEAVVHEKTGVYQNISANGHVGIALSEDIDLRLFFSQWHAGFAITELAANPQNRPQSSLQFFNKHGLAVHKIFPRDQTNMAQWSSLIEANWDPDLTPSFLPKEKERAIAPDSDFDVSVLLEDWAAMQDTHEFFGLLKKHNLERQQSLRLVSGTYTQRMAKTAVRDLLTVAAFDAVPIMCFVGNAGCIQIHSGLVRRIEPMDIRGQSWLNVLDPKFNLHLCEDQIDTCWMVRKPTADGFVTSLEVFDKSGELMTMFFGVRKPGQTENEAWREVLSQLPALTE